MLLWLLQLYKFVNQPSVAPADLVLLTDAFDVVLDYSTIDDLPARFAAVTTSGSNGRNHCSSMIVDGDNSHSIADPAGDTSNSCQTCLRVVFAAEKKCW